MFAYLTSHIKMREDIFYTTSYDFTRLVFTKYSLLSADIIVSGFFSPQFPRLTEVSSVWQCHFRCDKMRHVVPTDTEVYLSPALMFCSADSTVCVCAFSCGALRFHPAHVGSLCDMLQFRGGERKVTDTFKETVNT